MSSPAGNFSQMMIGTETIYGTPVTPTRCYDYTGEGLELKIERIKSKGLSGHRYVNKSVPGRRSAAGPTNHEFAGTQAGLLLEHMFGGVAITGAGPVYTQTFTPGDLPVSATVQIGKPSLDGVLNPFTYVGCRINDWELAVKEGELVTMVCNWVAQDEQTTDALATFVDPSPILLSFDKALVTVGGTQYDLEDFSLKSANTLDAARFRLRGASTPKQPLENGWREMTGSIGADFDNVTGLYALYQQSADFTLVANFKSDILIPSGGGGLLRPGPHDERLLREFANSQGYRPIALEDDPAVHRRGNFWWRQPGCDRRVHDYGRGGLIANEIW
jgi:hypothetical protein